MILEIHGNDMTKLGLRLLTPEGGVVAEQEVPGFPEEYLRFVDAFLAAQGKSPKDLTGILLPPLEGSATALRVSHALANAWGFVYGIPLIRSVGGVPEKILLPQYVSGPTITARKKDALHRKA